MTHYNGKKVLVTGGAGFIGSHVVEQLVQRGAKIRVAGRSNNPKFLEHLGNDVEYVKSDLLNMKNCLDVSKGCEIVFHLASKVGGIGYNIEHPATMFTTNTIINMQMLEAARKNDVEEYQYVSSTCVYPRHATVPTPESEGFKDDPEPSNKGYGWAKRVGELQAKYCSEEHGIKVSIVRPMNVYGPRDDFNLETAHVIPALIRRILESENKIKVWGSGNQTRGFVYVDDIANGLILAMEKYPKPDPINIGASEEVTIKELVKMILEFTGKKLNVEYDTSKPEGQLRKIADIQKARKLIGYDPKIPLRDGLKKMIEWYMHPKKKSIDKRC
jgi:GDP-L-fucose synthase